MASQGNRQIPPEIASVLENYFPNLDLNQLQNSSNNTSTSSNDVLEQTQSEEDESNSFVVDMTTDSENGEHGHTHTHSNTNNNNNGNGQNASPMRLVYKIVAPFAPFLLLVLCKLLYDHRFGILILVGLFGTFYQTNTFLKKMISLRERETDKQIKSAGKLFGLIGFLLGNILIIYYVLRDQELYRSLIFQLPNVGQTVDFWTLVWILGITDFNIRFIAIILKAVVTILPRAVIPFKRRGKYYMLIEYVCQFYRYLTPITPWYYYLSDTTHGGDWFAAVLVIIYSVAKMVMMWQKTRELKEIWSKFFVDSTYGSLAGDEDVKSAGNSCPICQDNFHEPIMLSCKHIFCEDCVSMWFDRERTCPMCRANIVDNPTWRDGSTSATIQLY